MKNPVMIGWREWVALPDLGVERVKAKADTGAATSALHVSRLRRERRDGETWLSFDIHPLQRTDDPTIAAGAWLVDERRVKNTSGRSELRPVIETTIQIGDTSFVAPVTLANRDAMGFRMLLGRRLLRRAFVVHPGKSFLRGAA